jgi:hypothetical protein
MYAAQQKFNQALDVADELLSKESSSSTNMQARFL